MKKQDDFLVEIQTEELPPKSLLNLAESFCAQMGDRLQKANLGFEEAIYYATPRRLAVLVKKLSASQPDQENERRGPALAAAYDANGKPTPACVGFARSCGVTPEELITLKNQQGEWVGYKQKMKGKSITELLPTIIEQAALALPIPKRMRWGANETQFVRPVHSVILLYGTQVIPATLLGCRTGNMTSGHRFHSPKPIKITSAAKYAELLEKKGHVIADFAKRRALVCEEAEKCVKQLIHDKGHVLFSSEELVNEVTGLVEWPTGLCGDFESSFLDLPQEVLISSMQDHQRYFPVVDTNQKLLPHFVTISNIKPRDAKRVIGGNERVLRARLSDAAFFYAMDKKESLESRVVRLKGIVFQAKLGTLYDKTMRVSRLAEYIAKHIQANTKHAARAGLLSKTDLTTNMVGEFPELQGVMGCYYARHDGEADDIAKAMQEQYLPRFAGDKLPHNATGQVLALADRIDTLIGAYGINQIPTGDKDPYGLRRAALGCLRILIEKTISLDLNHVLTYAVDGYVGQLENIEVVQQVYTFIQERLRALYAERGVSSDVFAAVSALHIADPIDIHERIKAVQTFKKLKEAETLSVANKRVSNILAKYVDTIDAKKIDPSFFETDAEKELAKQLEVKSQVVSRLYESGKYDEVLLQLAELRKPIDDFFDQVMVMTEDKPRRENRLLLLSKLRALFLQVADIALLQ